MGKRPDKGRAHDNRRMGADGKPMPVEQRPFRRSFIIWAYRNGMTIEPRPTRRKDNAWIRRFEQRQRLRK